MRERMTSYFQNGIEKKEKEADVENKEKRPQLNFEICYGPHYSAADFAKFKEPVWAADVYCPEGQYTAEHIKLLQQVADGKITPSEMQAHPSYYCIGTRFEKEMEETLYKSQKLIIPLDMEPNDSQVPVLEQISKQEALLRRDLVIGHSRRGSEKISFEEAIKEACDWARKMKGTVTAYREKIMLKNAKERIWQQIEEHRKELLKKDELKVVLTLGAAHTGLYREMKKTGLNVSRDFKAKFFPFGYKTALVRSYDWDRPVSEELAAKAVMEMILELEIPPAISNDYIKITKFYVDVIDRFTMEEMKNLFAGPGSPAENLGERLRAKGIKIPANETELDKFLK